MKRWENEAIRLKYNGRTHRQIADEVSKLTGIHVTESTIRTYFSVDGRLYLPYLEYEGRQNQWTEEDIRKELKRDAQNAVKMLRSILQKAIKAGEWQVALNIMKEQMDRGGVVTIKKSEINVESNSKQPLTYEQYLKESARLGIDPRSGLRVSKTPVVAD